MRPNASMFALHSHCSGLWDSLTGCARVFITGELVMEDRVLLWRADNSIFSFMTSQEAILLRTRYTTDKRGVGGVWRLTPLAWLLHICYMQFAGLLQTRAQHWFGDTSESPQFFMLFHRESESAQTAHIPVKCRKVLSATNHGVPASPNRTAMRACLARIS